MNQKIWVVVPAAGVGKRMQADRPKQYLKLAGQTLLDRTLERLLSHPDVEGIALGISEDDPYWVESIWSEHSSVTTFAGGAERSDTVAAGIRFLQGRMNLTIQDVLVHDAARPLVTHAALDRIIQCTHPDGAILALPARDTIKKTGAVDDDAISETLDRRCIWQAQTPQKFPALALLRALELAKSSGAEITDESSAMERIGHHPQLVMGESSNLKVTLPEDLIIAEALFLHQSSTES